MEKMTLIVLPAIVAVVAMAVLARGLVTKRPPGQRGLLGTGLEDSRTVYMVQMVSLVVLVLACISWIVWLLTRASSGG